MSKFLVHSGKPLDGSVKVSGAKNAALAVIPAALLGRGKTILENVPRIADVEVMLQILEELGVKVRWLDHNEVEMVVPDQLGTQTTYKLAKLLRASNLLLGSLLGRCGEARVAMPGGDDIGTRPMDLHTKGIACLGCQLSVEHGYIVGRAADGLVGGNVYLDFPSVGATENIMMAASVARGQTVIENCAKEPEIVDLANFLNSMGARIRGAGTDLIRIEGASELHGTRYCVIPDRIEAGTYMVAAALTRGHIRIENVIPLHLHAVIAKLKETGVVIEEGDDFLVVDGRGVKNCVDIKTLPYPGFPTDMQSQMMVLLSTLEGTSLIVENVYENRLRLVDELKRMGARIKIEGRTAVIEGGVKLMGAQVKATDLRAGAALILAGLAAQGTTEISCIYHIDRGYEAIENKFNALGASIERIS